MGTTILIIITGLLLILGGLGILGSSDFEESFSFYVMLFFGVVGIFWIIYLFGGGFITHIFFSIVFVLLTIVSIILLIATLFQRNSSSRNDMAGVYIGSTVFFGVVGYFIIKSLFS